MTPDWQPHVDLQRLVRWMDERALGEGQIENVVALAGGTQNILLRFRRGGRDFVLRRPPAHPRPGSDRTMQREAQVLEALRDTDVPHPRLIAACSDPDTLGAAFYLMEAVDGINVSDAPLPVHCRPEVQRRMGFAMVEAIARLAAVDPFSVGLEGFGKIDNYLARQAQRWRTQMESYGQLEGWPGPAVLPGYHAVGDWLEANCPSDFVPGVIHGDYHVGNVLFRADGGELAAIIDWELSTLGDPLIDLGWMIATWKGDDGSDPIVEVEPWTGFPTTEELVEHYARHSPRDLTSIDWYIVLACYKMGIILEGTHARSLAGLAERETGERLHGGAVRLFERAIRRLENT